MEAAHGLLDDRSRRSWGGEADSKHSPGVRLGLFWPMAESVPKRKGGRGLREWLCDFAGKEPVLSTFIRLNDGLLGAAILRLWLQSKKLARTARIRISFPTKRNSLGQKRLCIVSWGLTNNWGGGVETHVLIGRGR